jgi:hypothetical protein
VGIYIDDLLSMISAPRSMLQSPSAAELRAQQADKLYGSEGFRRSEKKDQRDFTEGKAGVLI